MGIPTSNKLGTTKNKHNYLSYINSPAWQDKRQQCFKIHGKRCAVCKKTKNIHVHHKTYKNLQNEDVEKDLIPLCDKHHKNLHAFCKTNKLTVFIGSNRYLSLFGIEKLKSPKKKRKFKLRKKAKQTKKKIKATPAEKAERKKEANKVSLDQWNENLKLLEEARNLTEDEIYQRMLDRRAAKQIKI